MGLADLTEASAVVQAIAEFDRLGRNNFLAKYGFGKAKSYFVKLNGRQYDSKAIVAAAYGYQFPNRGALSADGFSGGDATVATKLESLGFEMIRPSRNPTWEYDELILAMDLYIRKGIVGPTDPEVIELSELLNRLPIHESRPNPSTFRNPNGICLKLANIAALDPAYPGAGMTAGGKRDAEVWERFHNNQTELHRLAELLRTEDTSAEGFPVAPEEGEDEVVEGRVMFRRHRTRERDKAIVARKKASALRELGRLRCEVCGFDFEETYGELGSGYIECHHTVALADSGSTRTRLSDLALLCSNCHRMIHRRRPFASIDELRQKITPSEEG